MIGLAELNEKILTMRQLAETVAAKKTFVKNKLAEIEGEGRSEKWTEAKKREALSQSAAEISSLIEGINAANAQIAAQERFWNDRELVLSKIPLTKRGADAWGPENPAGESLARAGLLAEASRMSNERLALMAEDAAASGNAGAAYLFALEGNSRKKSANISTAAVEIPEQQAALSLFLEARKTAAHAMLDLKEASGARPNELTIGRLNAERGLM